MEVDASESITYTHFEFCFLNPCLPDLLINVKSLKYSSSFLRFTLQQMIPNYVSSRN